MHIEQSYDVHIQIEDLATFSSFRVALLLQKHQGVLYTRQYDHTQITKEPSQQGAQ